MLLQNVVSAIFETEHICPSILCCGIFLGISSLASTGTVNKRCSYLHGDWSDCCSYSWTWSSIITPCSNSESNHSHSHSNFTVQMVAFLLLANRDLFQASNDFSTPVIPAILCCLQLACLQFICSQIIWHFFLAFAGLFFIELSVLVAKNLYTLNTGAELAVNL